MRILADSKIPLVVEAFAGLGQVERFHTAELNAQAVRGAEILLVRSETIVDSRLLAGSKVEFVGTATIGMDHVDRDYLQSHGIGFASAPGSNARSVAEYVVAALLELAAERRESLRGRTLGVVGVGNIGKLVVQAGRLLDMSVLQNDPPRARTEPESHFHELREVLGADFVTLHVPLEKVGQDATWHLLDERRLGWMRPGSVLINTSRGPVVDNPALLNHLRSGAIGCSVLDVWENEPEIDCHLLRLTHLATPHIAGYSWDGKVRGTCMIYQACCRHFGEPATWTPPDHPQEGRVVEWPTAGGSLESRLVQLIRRSYSIRSDDQRLRALTAVPEPARGHYFRRLRREYPVRREFSSVRVSAEAGSEAALLEGLGFVVQRR